MGVAGLYHPVCEHAFLNSADNVLHFLFMTGQLSFEHCQFAAGFTFSAALEVNNPFS
ncbi:MAG: hypothetical protein MR704_12480 [Clostridia bacterium]|nr:hypothetical protein [Clostridia bacterium]